jgi:hypothetical protein
MAAVTVTTTPTALMPVSTNDVRFYIQNRGPSEVFFGPDNTLTAANGVGLAAGATLEYSTPGYLGGGYDMWFCTATGTADLRWVFI